MPHRLVGVWQPSWLLLQTNHTIDQQPLAGAPCEEGVVSSLCLCTCHPFVYARVPLSISSRARRVCACGDDSDEREREGGGIRWVGHGGGAAQQGARVASLRRQARAGTLDKVPTRAPPAPNRLSITVRAPIPDAISPHPSQEAATCCPARGGRLGSGLRNGRGCCTTRCGCTTSTGTFLT